MPEPDRQRLHCPQCVDSPKGKCTRFHLIRRDGKLYIKCERSECGWVSELAKARMITVHSEEAYDLGL